MLSCFRKLSVMINETLFGAKMNKSIKLAKLKAIDTLLCDSSDTEEEDESTEEENQEISGTESEDVDMETGPR